MDFLYLFLIFFKIGLFSFGGGLAMLPIIEREVLAMAWLSKDEFLKIISISQITPGAIAVNTATFVGQKVGGILGSIVASVAISLPSVIIMLAISSFLLKVQNHPIKISIFTGIKSITISLIIFAAFSIAKSTMYINNKIDVLSIIFTLMILLILRKSKLNPLIIIISSGIVSFLFF